MSSNRRISIIFLVYDFPPLRAGGTFRSLYFAKYLREFEIDPIVVTDNHHKVFKAEDLDYTLFDELPPDLTIYRFDSDWNKAKFRTNALNRLSEYFSIVDKVENAWAENVMKRIGGIIATHSPKAIFCSVPPFGMTRIAAAISNKYDLPIIFDFRDAWLTWNMLPFSTYLHFVFLKRLEGKMFRKAEKVVATSEATAKYFAKFHPEIDSGKFAVITNGYDKIIASKTKPAGRDKFVIGYVGSFYYSPLARTQMFGGSGKIHHALNYVPLKQDWLYRSPYFFFKAVRALLDADPQLADKIKIVFAGRKPDWLEEMVSGFRLNDVVEHRGALSHECSLSFQSECDALLITSAKVIGGEDYSIAGKTFEYISMLKPILAFVTKGAQKEIVQKTGLALICDPDDSHQSAAKLKSLIHGDFQIEPNLEFINGLSRKNLTSKLADVVRQVC